MKTNIYMSTLSLIFFFFFFFLSLPTLSHSQSCHPNDLKALRRIQQALGNLSELSWNLDSECCGWGGIECDDYRNNRVTTLNLDGVQTATTHIPDAIGDLPYLDFLSLGNLPNLTGGIPFALTRLTRLKMLGISRTNVSGPIPSFLSQIKSLISINLISNQLSGSIPPSLSSLPNLQLLDLSRNRLTGVIPESFGYFPHSKFYLDLSHNRLTGTVPRSLGYLNFTDLYFSSNKLVGDVSFLFGNNKTLERVNLSRNKFSFNGSNIKVNPELSNLDVHHNLITGNLPASLKYNYLDFLNVSYNQMCGEIPNATYLQKFDYSSYFHNRCLCGPPLPPCS